MAWQRARIAIRLGLGLLLLSVALSSRAELWAFIDDAGVAHFASEKLDQRYQLFFRSAKVEASPAAVVPAAEPATEVVAPDPDAARRLAWFERLPHYQPTLIHVQDASQRLNLDPHLLTALIAAESGFNPVAVSPKGALGLMQLMPDTATRYGVSADPAQSQQKKLFDPAINIRAGTRYLRDLLNLFNGKLELALAAYNAGEGAVQRAGNQIPAFRETQNYVKTVLQLYAALRPPPVVAWPVLQPPVPAPAPAPAILGGAIGRGNMIAPRTVLPALPGADLRN